MSHKIIKNKTRAQAKIGQNFWKTKSNCRMFTDELGKADQSTHVERYVKAGVNFYPPNHQSLKT